MRRLPHVRFKHPAALRQVTPRDLIVGGLYRRIALPLHDHPIDRDICVRQLYVRLRELRDQRIKDNPSQRLRRSLRTRTSGPEAAIAVPGPGLARRSSFSAWERPSATRRRCAVSSGAR